MEDRFSSELGSELLRRTLFTSHNLVKNKQKNPVFRMAVFIDVDGHKLMSYSYSNSRNDQHFYLLSFFSEVQLFSLVKLK